MGQTIRREELDSTAAEAGFRIQAECGGFRIMKDGRDVFPNAGICPVASKRECMVFLLGWLECKQRQAG
jgi:hypothetical protein